MSEQAEIAKSVAEALALKPYPETLRKDGMIAYERGADDQIYALTVRSVFEPYWQVACRDWLLERGSVYFRLSTYTTVTHGFFPAGGEGGIFLCCPASEFCARAIALTTVRRGEG